MPSSEACVAGDQGVTEIPDKTLQTFGFSKATIKAAARNTSETALSAFYSVYPGCAT